VSSTSDDTYRRILSVTSDVMIDEGIDTLKVADVAERCGVSEATVYYYFADRAHLIAAAAIDEIERYAVHAYEAYRHFAETATDLADAQAMNVQFLLAEDTDRRIRARWNFIQVSSRASSDQLVSILLNRSVDRIWTMMEHLYGRMTARGWVRPGLDVDALIPYLMAEIMCTALDSVRFGSAAAAAEAAVGTPLTDHLPKLRRALARSVAVQQHDAWEVFDSAKGTPITRSERTTVQPDTVSPRAAVTRSRILDAARSEILEMGPLEFHLRAVAERAGVSVATLYKYFPSREALLHSAADVQALETFAIIIETVRDRLPTTTETIDAATAEVDERIVALMRHDGVKDLRWQMIQAMTVGRRTIAVDGGGAGSGADPSGLSPELAPLLADPRFRDLWSITILAMAITDLGLRPAPSIEVQEATFLHVCRWILGDHDG
jgi:AcrR family transcriptional regulator